MSIKKIFLYTLSLLCCFSAVLLFCSCKPSTEASANTLRPTAEPTPVPRDTENDTKLSASMVYANNAANKVQGYYDTAARNKYIIDNKNSKTIINLSGDNLGLQSLGTLNGAVFIEGGMTGYVITSEGTKYTVANSNSSGRINANRIGYYYYEVNLRDLSFTNKISDDSQITKASDITNYNAGSLYGNMISDIAVNNKVISAKITGTSDPYLVMPVSANLDGCNMVKLEMSVKGSALLHNITVGLYRRSAHTVSGHSRR